MKVLEAAEFVLKPLIDPASYGWMYKCFIFLFFLADASQFWASVLYFVENIENLNNITQAIYVITGIALAFTKWYFFVRHADNVQDILSSFRKIVDGGRLWLDRASEV